MKASLIIASLVTILASCSCTTTSSTSPSNREEDDSSSSTQCGSCNSGGCGMNNNSQDADWQITTRVKSAIMSDGSVSATGRLVHVDTNDGVVTLTGNVETKEESRYIEQKVQSVDGVRQVNNQLTVKS